MLRAHAVCLGHRSALQDALADIERRGFSAEALDGIDKDDRRLLDQFAYRYTRLQDDLGARLLPAVLRALGEDVTPMPVIDRLNRLEQLGWLPSAADWAELRRIRNEFAHDYPETAAEGYARLTLAMEAARRLIRVLEGISLRIAERFGPP